MTWEYIAGFFDGEGSVLKFGSESFRVSLSQTHEGVLLDILAFVGSGAVVKVTKRKDHWKDAWVFFITKEEDTLSFLKGIEPYAVVKKEKIAIAISVLGQKVRSRKKHEAMRDRFMQTARHLRSKGLTYREIGAIVWMSWSRVRRVLLAH